MQTPNRRLLSLTLLMSAASLAGPPEAGWLQLQKLNQDSRYKLENQQETYTKQQPTPVTLSERSRQQQLFRQQQLQQQSLQRSQLHQRLIEEQQSRVTPTERSSRLDGLFRQQRFRQEQQRQLQRFDLQPQRYRRSR